MKRNEVKKKRRILVIIPAALLLFIIFELLISKYGLSVSYYEISSEEIGEEIRIVELADVHGSVFGKDNVRLVESIAAQVPDLILIAGDLIDASDEDLSGAQELIQALCAIAPVYISYGNHEKEYEEAYGVDIAAVYEVAGGADSESGSAADGETKETSAAADTDGLYPCTVLDFSYVDIEVNGQTVRLGGVYGYCLPESYIGEARENETAFLKELQDTDLYTILLCHMPVCWTVNNGLEEWEINCVLTGHAHGGQVILPGIGGLWAPDMGWFPGVLAGIVTSEDGEKTLVYSRGLGSTEVVPRFNNIPEIVVVDLKQENG